MGEGFWSALLRKNAEESGQTGAGFSGPTLTLQVLSPAPLPANLIDDVVPAQEPSGSLNTYCVDDRATDRLRWFQGSHELYCLGHLL